MTWEAAVIPVAAITISLVTLLAHIFNMRRVADGDYVKSIEGRVIYLERQVETLRVAEERCQTERDHLQRENLELLRRLAADEKV